MLLELFHVTRQKNTTLFLAVQVLLLVASSWWLFGSVWTWVLCVASGFSYCATSYVCYRPEAEAWRAALSEWYEKLFVWSFSYHHSSHPLHGTHTSGSSLEQDHAPSKSNQAPLLLESRTVGDLSSGVPLNAVRPPQPQAVEKGKDDGGGPVKICHKEAQKIIQLVMKDFILTWYKNVTSDTEFSEDVQKILEHIALEVNVRLQKVDYQEAIVELLELILPYLEVLNEAGIRRYSGVELFDVTTEMCVKQFEANPRVAHYAMKSSRHEKRHYRQVVDALIQCAFPPEYAKCDVACMLVREVLVMNVIEPLFGLLCDPAFLYEAIPLILAKATLEKISRQLDDIKQENEELERILNRGHLIVNSVGSLGRNRRRFCTTSGSFGPSSFSPSPDLPPRRNGRARPQSIAVFPYMQRTSSGVYESSQWLTQSSRTRPLHSTIEEGTAEATYPPPTVSPKRFASSSSNNTVATKHSVKVSRAGGRLSCEHNSMVDVTEEGLEEHCDYGNAIDGEYAVVELSPIFIERHVRVEGVGKTYVAYIFKFPKWMLIDADLQELRVMDSDTHLEGIKRYSEFSKFHSDLMASSSLSLHAKGLTLPEKRHFSSIISKLPFTSSEPDTTIIIERKQGLEKYLQSVSSVEVIINSDLFCQFLKSGVKNLKEANVVNPRRTKRQNRMSFLGRVKGEDKAEPVPKRPLENVLSSYLNTHLPLPCQLNSPNAIRKKREPHSSHRTASAPDSPTREHHRKVSSSHHGKLQRPSRGSVCSLASTGSGGNSSPSLASQCSAMHRNHSFHGDLQHSVERPSPATFPDSSEGREHGYQGTKAVFYDAATFYDTVSTSATDGAESAVSSSDSRPGSRSLFSEEEEEEACTIGVPAPSLPRARKLSAPPQKHSSSFTTTREDHPLSQTRTQVTQLQTNTQVQGDNDASATLPWLRSLLYKLLVYMHRLIVWLVSIVVKGMEPVSKDTVHALIKLERRHAPLSNVLFSMGSEASVRACPQLWACSQNTQLSLLVLAGGGVERFLWRELKLVLCDEVSWMRALYSLRHTLWPGGVFIEAKKRKLSEEELEQLKIKAADAFKKFLPNFLPTIVGPAGYDRSVVHCLDCLRNPRLNRHFLLRVVDLLVVRIIPEIAKKDFQKHLSQLRTLQPLHSTTD